MNQNRVLSCQPWDPNDYPAMHRMFFDTALGLALRGGAELPAPDDTCVKMACGSCRVPVALWPLQQRRFAQGNIDAIYCMVCASLKHVWEDLRATGG